MKKESGICYIAGAGPGDPGLLTLRARECIETADTIVYDYLVSPEILQWARPDAEMIYAGKQAGNHTLTQEEINRLILERTAAGHTVLRLKGGDPYIFGRGGEEAAELAAAGLAFEVVPGISSAIAGPAYAGIPVTHRAHNTTLTLFTGHEDPAKEEESLDFAKLAKADGTKVMLMGVGRIAALTARLIEHGANPATPVALVRWATTPRQQTLTGTLGDIAEKVTATGFKAPAVCIIGDVCTLRDPLNWFENRPLFGRRIVVTRTREKAGKLGRALTSLGAAPIELPLIETNPPTDLMAFGQLVRDSHTYQWIVFTSPTGVDAFFEMFFKLYPDIRSIGGARFAAVGPGTAARIREHKFDVDLVADPHTAEGLVEAFRANASVENEMILWVRPERARPVIQKGLADLGAIVDEALAYRTVPAKADPALLESLADSNAPVDAITFTSASTVEFFFELNPRLHPDTRLASIGPITSAALRDHGHEPHIEASQHDIPGLVSALSDYFTTSRS